MAEAAGLALGVLGLSGLFSACIENFDIVVKARAFGEEFDLLCTLLSLQRIRLLFWGQSVGLVAGVNGSKQPYKAELEWDSIRPAVEQALNHLRLLLERADGLTGRYHLQEDETKLTTSHGMTIFQNSFERFKLRLRKNQTQKSTWTVTRWAVHDLSQFEALVDKIKSLVDGLESVTSSLGLLEQQQTLLDDEIESVSDAQSLRLLRDATAGQPESTTGRSISDRASQRLSMVGGKRSIYSGSSHSIMQSSISFHTAPSHPFSNRSVLHSVSLRTSSAAIDVPAPDRELVELGVIGGLQRLRIGIQEEGPQTTRTQPEPTATKHDPSSIAETLGSVIAPKTIADVPQNVRIIRELLKQQRSRPPSLSFKSGAHLYGKTMTSTVSEDEELWHTKSPSLLSVADSGVLSARRVFLELRSIRRAGIPFISAAPVGDALDKVLASIEGPPDTPYAGGIFRISVKFSDQAPSDPPSLRFQTRIYHPNIDCRGNICADYKSWWSDPDLSWFMGTQESKGVAWFSEKKTNHFALGAVLTSLCGLLASPNIEDPLVPEIAEKYVTDYPAYWAAAKSFTETHATMKRPEDDTIEFEEDGEVSTVSAHHARPGDKHQDDTSTASAIIAELNPVMEEIRRFQDDEARSERNIFASSASSNFEDSDAISLLSSHSEPSTIRLGQRAGKTVVHEKPPKLEMRVRTGPPRSELEAVLDPKQKPRMRKMRFSNGRDWFSPSWVRGVRWSEEGWCGRCQPGHWIPLGPEWRFHQQFVWGIAESTGDYVFKPTSRARRKENDSSAWVVQCHKCGSDVDFAQDEHGGHSWYFHVFEKHPSELHDIHTPGFERMWQILDGNWV